MAEPNGYLQYFQQRNAITVLRSLHHIESPHWSLVKEYATQKLGASSLSDFCYRKLCKQLVDLELAQTVKRGPLKRDYHLTKLGHETAEIIEEALTRIEKWQARAEKNQAKKK